MPTLEERVALLESANEKTQKFLLVVSQSLDANAKAHDLITKVLDDLLTPPKD